MEKKNIGQFIRFVIVGGFATVLHYAIYLILQNIGIGYSIAYTIGYFTSFIFNFFASNYITFKTNPDRRKIIKFTGAHGFNYVLQMILLNVFIFWGVASWLAPFFVYAIAVPSNFVLVRLALKDRVVNGKEGVEQ